MNKLWVLQGYTTGCDGGGPSKILGVFDTQEQAKTEEEKEPNYATWIDEVILNLPCKTEERLKNKRNRLSAQKEIIADLMEFFDEINRHRKKPGPIDWEHALGLDTERVEVDGEE